MDSIRKVYSYNDVLLSPRHSDLEHLTDAQLMSHFDAPKPFSVIPVINAPMDTVCSTNLLSCLSRMALATTVHRLFNTVKDQIDFLVTIGGTSPSCFVAVGNIDKWERWIDTLLAWREETGRLFGILVDVANGDTKSTVKTVEYLRKIGNLNIMAGNVATKSGFSRLQDAGANFIRVGLGGSSICSTRLATGFGLPTLTSIWDCEQIKSTAYLVADGGIETTGDICKAIGAGADMVMCGKLFAATSLAGNVLFDKDKQVAQCKDDAKYCSYRGMASKESSDKFNSKKTSVSVEGVSGLIPYTGETEEVLNNMLGNLRSSMAYYAGCRTWEEFKRKLKFVEISNQGWEESKTRVI